ncbi:MAG: hypothetical protein HZC26_00975 [Candidatus Magasanikbacteria bacterium]|nr:hypothetical protein [Candidatus Magasanikbacteria bacterium]
MSRQCLSKKTCQACGNNPTPHFSTWLAETAQVFLNPLDRMIIRGWVYRLLSTLAHKFFIGSIYTLKLFGAAKLNSDSARVVCERGKVFWQEAIKRGILMQNFIVFGRSVDVYQAMVRGRRIYFNGLPRPIVTSSGSELWLDDKELLKRRLRQASLPIARGGSFSRWDELLNTFHQLDKPVILKPRLGSRGRHTTTNVFTLEELKRAFQIAKQLCHWVVMEEHLEGSVYRATLVNGKLVGLLRGDPPRVVGDGVHTIAELVDIKNKNKHPLVSEVVVDNQHLDFLTRGGLTLSSVPASGETVDLLEKIGVSYGGWRAEVIKETHPEIKKIMEQVAAAVNDPLVGFDFIIKNVSSSPQGQKWGIIECNGTPFIDLHHEPLAGEPSDVARELWDYVEENVRRF